MIVLLKGILFFRGIYIYSPPSFKKHNLMLCQFGFWLLISFVQLF